MHLSTIFLPEALNVVEEIDYQLSTILRPVIVDGGTMLDGNFTVKYLEQRLIEVKHMGTLEIFHISIDNNHSSEYAKMIAYSIYGFLMQQDFEYSKKLVEALSAYKDVEQVPF